MTSKQAPKHHRQYATSFSTLNWIILEIFFRPITRLGYLSLTNAQATRLHARQMKPTTRYVLKSNMNESQQGPALSKDLPSSSQLLIDRVHNDRHDKTADTRAAGDDSHSQTSSFVKVLRCYAHCTLVEDGIRVDENDVIMNDL